MTARINNCFVFIFFSILLLPVSSKAQYVSPPILEYSFGNLSTAEGDILSDKEALDCLGYIMGSKYHYSRLYYKVGAAIASSSPILAISGLSIRNKALVRTVGKTADGSNTTRLEKNHNKDVLGYSLTGLGIVAGFAGCTMMLVNRKELISIAKRYNYTRDSDLSFAVNPLGLEMKLSF